MIPGPLPFLLKKKPFPRKIQQRCDERRLRMTLVSTLMGRNGVVMFSDNQETRGGYSKKTVDKLCVWDFPSSPFRLAISGATDNATYLDMLESTLTASLLKLKTFSLAEIHATLSEELTVFYSKHIWPQSVAPLMEFLITVQPLPIGIPEVIHVSGTAVLVASAKEHYKSIGVGAHLADYLFGVLLGGGQTQAELAMAAIYVGKEVNENVDGCGPIERIVMLGDEGEYWELQSDNIRQIENNLNVFRQMQGHTFSAVADVEGDEPTEELGYIAAGLMDARRTNAAYWNDIQEEIRKHAEYRSTFMPRMKTSL